MIAIIPAAGYATRLGDLVKEKPKHLLEVGTKPILNYVFEGISNLSVAGVFLVTNDKFYNRFIDWQKNFETNLKITIINDGTSSNDDRFGTVGDIAFAIKKGGIDDDLFIVAGDNLYCEEGRGYNLKSLYDSFLALEKKAGIVGLYDVRSLEIAKQMNQMVFAGGKEPKINERAQILKMTEKDPNPFSTIIATLIEIYPRKTIELINEYLAVRENHDKMGDFRSWLISENKIPLYGHHLAGKWFDIGSPETLNSARLFYQTLD